MTTAARTALLMLCWLLAGTVTTTVSAQQQPDIFDYPQTLLQGEVSATFTRDADGCRSICSERTGCAGFSHSAQDANCRLFSSVTGARSDDRSDSGARRKVPGYAEPANELSWFYARFRGIDFWGGDIAPKGYEMFDARACEQACEDESSCRAYTFNTARNRCFLKTGFDFAQSTSDGIGGLYFKAIGSQENMSLDVEWVLALDRDILGHDLYRADASTYVRCMDACGRDDRCSGFVLVTSATPSQCYLKTGAALQTVTRRGMSAALRYHHTKRPELVRAVSAR